MHRHPGRKNCPDSVNFYLLTAEVRQYVATGGNRQAPPCSALSSVSDSAKLALISDKSAPVPPLLLTYFAN